MSDNSEHEGKTPVPEWQKSEVLLVDPTCWKYYQQRPHDLRPVYAEITVALRSLGIEPKMIEHECAPIDIWIRDWGFVDNCYFAYAPTYARNLYTSDAIARARLALNTLAGRSPSHSSLVLDGGNLVHNGDFALLTEKVLFDNPSRTRAEIEAEILALGFEQVVFLPVEPDDNVGHADGIVRFLDENTLLVNNYDNPGFGDYRQTLYSCLRAARIEANIIPFPWFSTDTKLDRIYSAVGVYINFIHTVRGIVYPTFSNDCDELVAELLASLTPLPSRSVSATPIAICGGVLNCVTLTF